LKEYDKIIDDYANSDIDLNIAGNIWDDSEEICAFLKNYDSPFWHIWNGDRVISIEIHADLSALDKAVRIMLKSNFNKNINIRRIL